MRVYIGGICARLAQTMINIADKRPYVKKPTCRVVRQQDIRAALGIAVCNRKLYTIESRSDVVYVHDADPPFACTGQIKTCSKNPHDIVAYDPTASLYIADPFVKCVWRLSTGDFRCARFAAQVDAWSLSVDADRKQLLVTSPSCIDVYGLLGGGERRLRRIALPSHVDAMHAVATPTGRLLVSHTGTGNDHGHHQVSEIDADSGAVLRAFGDRKGCDLRLISYPTYMDLDDRGRVFVADYNNRRVVLLDLQRLTLERVLLTVDDGEDGGVAGSPWRVRYLPRLGQLLVATNTGSVNAYGLLAARRQVEKDSTS